MKWMPFLLLLLFTSCSKFMIPDGVYFSGHQDCLVMDQDASKIESKENSIIDNLRLKQTRKKLKFRWVTYSPGRLLFKKNVSRYFFRFMYKTEDSFMVSPLSKLAKKHFSKREYIVFKTKYLFADQTNYFNKIIFHSSRCFGLCDDLHLELDKAGNLKVTNNGNGITDTAKNENYYGKVSYEDLERLNRILQYSQLKTLEWPPRNCHDLPDLTLILYQNDKRYYFKINAACLPIVSGELTGYLHKLFRYETLKKADTTFVYER